MYFIFDLDGTIALGDQREYHLKKSPPDWDAYFAACGTDYVNYPVVELLRMCAFTKGVHAHRVDIWSGRSKGPNDEWLRSTIRWLNEKCEVYVTRGGRDPYRNAYQHAKSDPRFIYRLRMREYEDHTPDHLLKARWLEEAIAVGDKPDMVFEDRDRVVQMWRDRGIPCLQVAPGAF